MKFNSATYKNNFTKNDNFIVENVKVIKIVIAVCTCIIGAIWLLFVLICSKKGAETGNLIPTLIFTLVFIIAIYFSMVKCKARVPFVTQESLFVNENLIL